MKKKKNVNRKAKTTMNRLIKRGKDADKVHAMIPIELNNVRLKGGI